MRDEIIREVERFLYREARLLDERQGKQSLIGNEGGTRIVPRQPKENGTLPAPKAVRGTK